MNSWKHVRLAGAVVCITAAFLHNIVLSLFGLLLIAVGVINGLHRLERFIEEHFEEKEDETLIIKGKDNE